MRLLLAEDEKSLSRAVKAILEKNNFSVDAVYCLLYTSPSPRDRV